MHATGSFVAYASMSLVPRHYCTAPMAGFQVSYFTRAIDQVVVRE